MLEGKSSMHQTAPDFWLLQRQRLCSASRRLYFHHFRVREPLLHDQDHIRAYSQRQCTGARSITFSSTSCHQFIGVHPHKITRLMVLFMAMKPLVTVSRREISPIVGTLRFSAQNNLLHFVCMIQSTEDIPELCSVESTLTFTQTSHPRVEALPLSLLRIETR